MHEHDVSWWSDWLPVEKVIRLRKLGNCKGCDEKYVKYKELYTLTKVEETEKRSDGKKRGKGRSENQPKCECTHYYYQHEKGSCTKCNCVK